MGTLGRIGREFLGGIPSDEYRTHLRPSPDKEWRGGELPASITDAAVMSGRYDMARLVVRARKERDLHFGDHAHLFEDPAWNVMLDLYISYHRHEAVCVTSAVIASGVATTTGLRLVGNLEKCGLIDRRTDPLDRRRSFLSLSDDGLKRIEKYLDGYASWMDQQHLRRTVSTFRDRVIHPL